jgi:hypothetical protein
MRYNRLVKIAIAKKIKKDYDLHINKPISYSFNEKKF